jgi:hypothetical protein
MKKYISILFVVGLLSCYMPQPCLAQDEITEYVADELKEFYKDLDKMGRRIDTAKNVEKYETEFKARHQLVESWYNINSEVIFSEKSLQMKYIQYTTLYEQIQNRIDEKKAEKAKAEKVQKLTTKFNGFLQELNVMEEKGNLYVANKRIDSLKIIKDKANDCFNRATMEYGKNQELIDEEEDLETLWESVKDTNSRISKLEVIKGFWDNIDLKWILMLVGVLAGITLIVTMISSKVKSAKMTKVPKVKKEKKKKEEDIPSI